MSLQLAAQHLASQGRGPDSMLIHMSPKEVQSLQAIARAHGGSLSINPETGLVEAGFLKNLLPMIAGMGITALTGGAAAPWMIGLGVGGVQAARTGSLEKGLMAGLGAYGGAGLMGGLSASAGAAEAANPASSLAGKAVPPIEQINPSNALSMGDKLKYGVQGLGTETGRGAALNAMGGGFKAARTAGMALAPALMGGEEGGDAPKDDERYNYEFNPGRVANPYEGYTGAATGERRYFTPSYTRLPNSKGMAAGGAIPYDSSGVARFDDGGFTNDKNMLGLQGAAAAQGVQPFNGAVPFAQQAVPTAPTGNIQPVANNPYYTMSGQSGDAYKYLMGLGPTSGSSPTVVTPPPYTPPTTGGADVVGGDSGSGPIDVPAGPTLPYEPPNFTLPDDGVTVDPNDYIPDLGEDTYDQDNQNAIDKIEQEVADEEYDQSNQDAIDKIEQEVADEEYDQSNQDAIDKIEQEVADEEYDQSNQDAIDKIEQEVADEEYDQSNQDAIDKIGQEVLDEQYDQNNQDAIDKIEQEVLDEQYDQNNQDAIDKIEQEVEDEGVITDPDDLTERPEELQPSEPEVEDPFAEESRPEPEPDPESAPYDPEPEIEDPLAEEYIEPEPEPEPEREEYIEPEREDLPPPPPPEPTIEDPFAEESTPEPEREEYIEPEREDLPPPPEPEPEPEQDTYIEPDLPVQPDIEPEPAPYTPESAPYDPEPEPYVPEPEPVAQPDPYYEDPFVEELPPEVYEDYFAGDSGGMDSFMDAYGDSGFGNSEDFDSYGYMSGNANGGLLAAHRYAMGGSTLGGYSDGGRLLRGPGDGVSDSIPASIGRNRQPARLADGEFVVPARIVSELGNGSTEAGARKLYAMMDRIQNARRKSIGKGNVAKNSRAEKYLPA